MGDSMTATRPSIHPSRFVPHEVAVSAQKAIAAPVANAGPSRGSKVRVIERVEFRWPVPGRTSRQVMQNRQPRTARMGASVQTRAFHGPITFHQKSISERGDDVSSTAALSTPHPQLHHWWLPR